MVAMMVELTQQNQELTKEVDRQRQQRRGEERGQNSENARAGNNAKGD